MKKLKAYACIHKSPTPKEWLNQFQTHMVENNDNIFALDIYENKEMAKEAIKGIKHLKVIPCAIIYN